ncbi:MAG: NAD(P)H-dependent oxidoreductase [Defluviitaleaceae bacterium]|nr:NAD(P)H-dependent oxidoreductase [Defluviitaleaceae bacterium]
MKALFISCSNMIQTDSGSSVSYKICQIAAAEMGKRVKNMTAAILELKKYALYPCEGCGGCVSTNMCVAADGFNRIYAEIIASDAVIFAVPHYAPVPAKLAALLEKMEEITYLKWGKDNSYKSEVFGKPAGVISHGGGGEPLLKSYKAMVNDTVANALDTIQMKIVPLDAEWDTGIALPVFGSSFGKNDIFPRQDYDWARITRDISAYVEQIVNIL